MNISLSWQIKGIIQLLLSKIAYGVEINHKLQQIRGAYSEKSLIKSTLIQARQIRDFNERKSIKGSIVLEIGTGWNLIGVVLFHLKGAHLIYGFDLLPHASFPISRKLVEAIHDNVRSVSEALGIEESLLNERTNKLLAATSKNEFFETLNFLYYAPGDAQDTKLPSESIDIIFSYGVLEHIPTDVLSNIFIETKRILKQDGRCYHNIGLHDHYDTAGLGNGVNFLRYPSWYWQLMTGNSISYHNRLRLSDYQRIFKYVGLNVGFEEKELLKKNLEALTKISINERFHGYSKDDLAASHLYVDLKK